MGTSCWAVDGGMGKRVTHGSHSALCRRAVSGAQFFFRRIVINFEQLAEEVAMGSTKSKEASDAAAERLKGPFSDHEFSAIHDAFKARAGKDGCLPQDAFVSIFQLRTDPKFATRLFQRFQSLQSSDSNGLELRTFVEGGKSNFFS
jgi:hypothetical protein